MTLQNGLASQRWHSSAHLVKIKTFVWTAESQFMKLSMLTKKLGAIYDVLFTDSTVRSWPKPINEQGTNMMVGTVATLALLMNRTFV